MRTARHKKNRQPISRLPAPILSAAILLIACLPTQGTSQVDRENRADVVFGRLEIMQDRIDRVLSDSDLSQVDRAEALELHIKSNAEAIVDEWIELRYEITNVIDSSKYPGFSQIHVFPVFENADALDRTEATVFYKKLSTREKRLCVPGKHVVLSGRVTYRHQTIQTNPKEISLEPEPRRFLFVMGVNYPGVSELRSHNLGIFVKRAAVLFTDPVAVAEETPEDVTYDNETVFRELVALSGGFRAHAADTTITNAQRDMLDEELARAAAEEISGRTVELRYLIVDIHKPDNGGQCRIFVEQEFCGDPGADAWLEIHEFYKSMTDAEISRIEKGDHLIIRGRLLATHSPNYRDVSRIIEDRRQSSLDAFNVAYRESSSLSRERMRIRIRRPVIEIVSADDR